MAPGTLRNPGYEVVSVRMNLLSLRGLMGARGTKFLAAVLIAVALGAPEAAKASVAPAVRGVSVLGWKLQNPGAMVVKGADLFVATNTNAVAEFSVATGALVKVPRAPSTGSR